MPVDPIRTNMRTFFIIGDGGEAHSKRQEEAKRYTYRIYCGSGWFDGYSSDSCNGIMEPVIEDGKIKELRCTSCGHRLSLYEATEWNLEVLKDGKKIQEREERY